MSRFRSITSFVGLALALAACGGKDKKADPTPAESVDARPSGEGEAQVITEEISFAAAGMTIRGSVTRPAGAGPFPAIAVAAGSGPTDRDWNNPLLPGDNGSAALLGQALAERGVVLLRYDKRGTGKTGMPVGSITWSDYIAELTEALKYLAAQPYVDNTRLHVAGHSEGGAHALKLAAAPAVDVASLILLSTAGRSLRDIVLWQIGNQIAVSGMDEAAGKAEMESLEKALDRIIAKENVDPTKVSQLPGIQQFVAALQAPASVDFAQDILGFEPAQAFQTFELPVLVLSGERDIQVDPELDAKPLAEASEAAGRPTKLVLVPTADHVLKHEDTPRAELTAAAGLRYNAPDRSLAEGVADAIADWAKNPVPAQ